MTPRLPHAAAALAALTLLATAPAALADPLESVNRAMFDFNTAAVDGVIAPATAALRAWVPEPVRQAGHNMYENLTEPEFIVAHLLDGNHGAAAASLKRLAINSTVGLAGVFDVATAAGVERTPVAFGGALCRAGLPAGDYLVLPLVGPTNVAMATAITGFIVGGWYGLSLISAELATADLVVDVSASAASLRHAGDAAPDGGDPYQLQRRDYWDAMAAECPAEAG